MRIGEVARRAGVSVSTVRAWEQRYDLFELARTAGGHRRYDEKDLARLLGVQHLVAQGWTLPAAARHISARAREERGPSPDGDRAPDELVALIERSDRLGALRLVQRLLGNGATIEQLLVDVLAPVQVEVGTRWEHGRWSVSEEHAATAVVADLLGWVTSLLPERPPWRGELVLACVEGEHHELPARMAGEMLRRQGWDVRLLGASVPADDLAAYLRSSSPAAVGLSCSTGLNLRGARRSIEAARDAGVFVLAGGAGFGSEGRHAVELGAHAWAGSASAFELA
jgi:methanogenic corrinoid protein MtbC1